MSAIVNIIQAEALPLGKLSILTEIRVTAGIPCGQGPLGRIWTLCIGVLFLEQVEGYFW
jgi:hypothetical protein